MFDVKVIEDSVNSHGRRLTTLQLTYPRMVHSELLTHRVFSRNASSSRAIPVARMAELALTEMVEPIRWGKNQPGMQAGEANLTGIELAEAQTIWRKLAEQCAAGVKRLGELGLHKQWANRPLEWFSNIRVVLSSTDFSNWDELRRHPDAMPEIDELARLIIVARAQSTPALIGFGEWHLPYVTQDERNDRWFDTDERNDRWFNTDGRSELLRKMSAARCCRVSYLRHDGLPASVAEELALCERLMGGKPFHASPFEHVATPLTDPNGRSGNFSGWLQYRQVVESAASNASVFASL